MEDKYWQAACDKCGWTGSSKLLKGGQPIPETGDYDDLQCPQCWSTEVYPVEQTEKRKGGK